MPVKKVLVVGASGFIGSHIVAYLQLQNYKVKCATRDVDKLVHKFPGIEVVRIDFNQKVSDDTWRQYCQDVDVVINAAGVLDGTSDNKIENVHIEGPTALLNAAIRAGVRRIIHISALGIAQEHDTLYASTKKKFDEYCAQQDKIDWVILQPSLVYAAASYGGTSLLRGLASLPFFIPLIGEGDQKFQPVHMDDLVSIVERCIAYQGKIRDIFPVVGPDIVQVKDILSRFRGWLGLAPAAFIKLPKTLIKYMARIGDYIGIGPLRTTSLKMMEHPNVGDYGKIIQLTGVKPRSFTVGLNSTVLTVQSLWHARFYLVEPVIRLLLAIFWIYTGIITMCNAPLSMWTALTDFGLPSWLIDGLIKGFSVLDIAIGLAAMSARYAAISYMAQFVLVTIYTITLTYLTPGLWLDPLGSLSKNIPILLLIMLLLLLQKGR